MTIEFIADDGAEKLARTGGVLYQELLREGYDIFELPIDAPCLISSGGVRRYFGSFVSLPIAFNCRDGD